MKTTTPLALASATILSLANATDLNLWYCVECRGTGSTPVCNKWIFSQSNGASDCNWIITSIPSELEKGDQGTLKVDGAGTCHFYVDVNR